MVSSEVHRLSHKRRQNGINSVKKYFLVSTISVPCEQMYKSRIDILNLQNTVFTLMKPWVFVVLFIQLSFGLEAQLNVNFDNGDLSIWTGDLSDFIINDENILQLAAPEAGTSSLFTPITVSDSILWSMDIEMDFAPSTSNLLDYWILKDTADPNEQTGFLLRFGESGSDDAIQFFEVENGAENRIASGPMGQIANGFSLRIILTKSLEDEWILSSQEIGSDPVPVEAFRVFHETEDLTGNHFLGWTCQYTSTRTDRFFFDNIIVEDLLPDTAPPSVVSVEFANSDKIIIQFSEVLDAASVAELSNYRINTSEGNQVAIARAIISADDPTSVCLELSEGFPIGAQGEITIADIQDQAGNSSASITLALLLASTPELGDILINEILYDPLPGNDADYVEIINVSDKILSLDEVFFARANSTAVDVQVMAGTMMTPGQIIAFTDDRMQILENYLPPDTANIVELNITNYVNDEGNVSVLLKSNNEVLTLDSFDYTDDFHSPLLTNSDIEGVSLERLSTISETNDSNNWFSAAASVNYGTPGYTNSQRISSEGVDVGTVELQSQRFSPDADGFEDFAVLQYSLEKSGFIGNVAVHDDHGRLELPVAENTLLSTEGNVLWEGNLEDGTPAPIGMYIIVYDFFHPDGDVISGKEVIALVRRL